MDTEKHHRLTEVFLTACRAGDLESLKNLLAEDVTVFSDGGGRATVALRPVVGADKVARFFLGLASKMTGTASFEPANLNSTPAWIARVDGRIDHVGWPMVAGDGISAFYIVRIDHFRGFESYWEIPADSETAATGKWVKGPGYALFKAVKEALGELNIIAEDLGFMTDEVIELREQTGFPGMKILQFAFNPKKIGRAHV